jgi:hypothetical protein
VLPVLAGGLKRGVWCVQEWTEQYRTAPTARPVPRLSPISGIANPLYRLDRACSLAGRRVADQCRNQDLGLYQHPPPSRPQFAARRCSLRANPSAW